MVAKEMEARLLELGAIFLKTRSEDVRREYVQLWSAWRALKSTESPRRGPRRV
jgi:hypothetical protein